ncbi:MAG: hypothetical protein GXY03_14250 [Solirubrobacterales bacterium]|nr:hypothetical protein [Solirubrobacterales bacterium]
MKRFTAAVAAVAGVLLIATTATAAAETVVVTGSDLGGDWHAADTRPGGTATWETGPAAPPLGTDSVELSTADAAAKVQLLTDVYADTPLAAIDGIGYSTYRDPLATGFVAGVASLNARVDLDGDGTADVYMVYEPYQDQGNAAVLTGAWQTWDAYRGGDALWWINTGAGGCGQATPCTWSEIVGLFPDAAIREGTNVPIAPGSLGFNQGSGNAGFLTNVDGLLVSVDGEETVYDFELTAPDPEPDDPKGECKKRHGKHGHGHGKRGRGHHGHGKGRGHSQGHRGAKGHGHSKSHGHQKGAHGSKGHGHSKRGR